MKILSVAIPCYNSEKYMEKCIESLLPGGEDVEILIVDDGSKDRTAEIADAYEKKYPGIVKAIHQENGGHGEACILKWWTATTGWMLRHILRYCMHCGSWQEVRRQLIWSLAILFMIKLG